MNQVKTLTNHVWDYMVRKQMYQAYDQGDMEKAARLAAHFDRQQLALIREYQRKKAAK